MIVVERRVASYYSLAKLIGMLIVRCIYFNCMA